MSWLPALSSGAVTWNHVPTVALLGVLAASLLFV